MPDVSGDRHEVRRRLRDDGFITWIFSPEMTAEKPAAN
jgi:hypothetical protein